MAQEDPNSFSEWLDLVRRQIPVVRGYFDEWLAAVREEPALIWETPAVRYTAYGVGGLTLFWLLTALAGGLVPPPPSSARPMAGSADYHIVCAAADCGGHFVIHRPFGFSKFPVACPKCRREAGIQARRCYSEQCLGKWVAPKEERDAELSCSVCGNRLESE